MTPESDQNNSYLEQEVLSASPVRLRWMLIRRAEELCSEVERLWNAGEDLQAGGWLIRIREILGELLGGVQNNDNPVNESVADFYVFLLKLLNKIDQNRDIEELRTLASLLHLENETWEAVVQKFSLNDMQEKASSSRNTGDLPVALQTPTELRMLKSVDDLLSTTHSLNLEI